MDQTSSAFICTGDEASGHIALSTSLSAGVVSNDAFMLDAHALGIMDFHIDRSVGGVIDHPVLDGATSDKTTADDPWTQISQGWG